MQRRHSRNQISKVEDKRRERTKMKNVEREDSKHGSNLRIAPFPMKKWNKILETAVTHVRRKTNSELQKI